MAHRFQDRVRPLGITLQVSIKQRPESNGMIESTNGKFKADYIWPKEPTTFLETRPRVAEGVTDYNGRKLHSSLGYRTPMEYARLWKIAKTGA